MCGIAGFYGVENKDQLKHMLQRIVHRGPDADGVYYAKTHPVGLGHRRLSIIDLSHAADQPFQKDDWVIVFNGEIYNYLELKKELSSLGATFVSNSDTEVLLEAWRYWGEQCLQKLRGMYVFALYHEASQELFFARDPFGIKPLFYSLKDSQLLFASELKALTPFVSHDIDPTALVSSLMYVWIPDAHCMFQHVHKFPAGHWSRFDGKQLTLHQYYFPETLFTKPKYESVTVDQLESVLLDSVQHHLIADVPVATFLSGGLDSSLLTAMAIKHNPNIQAYTIAFRHQDKAFEAMPDDCLYAKQLAKQLGIQLNEVQVSPNIVEMLPKMVQTLDEPIGDGAALNTYLICQMAREQGIKVLLSGMGADELFGGYRRHYACLLAQNLQRFIPSMASQFLACVSEHLPVAGKHGGYKTLRWLKRFARFMNLSEEAAYRQSYTYYLPDEFEQLLTPDYAECIPQLLKEHEELYWKGGIDDSVNRMCHIDLSMFMLGLNLTYTDRASMAASTEVRVPYIDTRVAAIAGAMTGKQKIDGRVGKYLLKKVAELWLPHDIIYRPKAGFALPLRSWIRNNLRDMVDDCLLSANGLANRGIVNKNVMMRMIDEDRRGQMDYSQHIWQWLTLELWLREVSNA